MRRVPVLAILSLLACFGVAACAGTEPHAATAPPTEAPQPTAAVGASTFVAASSLPPAPGATLPSMTPYPTGIEGAMAYLQTYENDLIGGRYEAAWSMLAAKYKATLDTYDTYETERTAFMSIAGKSYTATANPTDIAGLADLVKDKPFAAAIDQKRAVVLSVQWPTLIKQGTPPEVWVVNPASGLGWELYRIR